MEEKKFWEKINYIIKMKINYTFVSIFDKKPVRIVISES